jgi:hypothetical protein
VARELDLTHANASYHLRVLSKADVLAVEGEEKIRGGVAKRYRYVVSRDLERPSTTSTYDDLVAWQHATGSEVVRRLAHRIRGPGNASDIETWVTPETWQSAMDTIRQAMVLLHEEARPPRTQGTIHVSASAHAFMMSDGS